MRKKWRVFLDKRLSEEVPADSLGDEFKGYVFKITGGFDKEGFPMMQGVMLNHRTRLLLDGRTGQYTPKRHGCRKRKSVRGCIIGVDMSCINVVIVKRGPVDLPKLTNKEADKPSVRGPKRADNIRKAWGLAKKDDVRQYVVKRVVPGKNGKRDKIKSPKIQRLITPVTRHRKRHRLNLIKKQRENSRKDAADYANLLAKIRASKRSALLSKRREAKSKLLAKASVKKVEDKKKAVLKKKSVDTKKGDKKVTEKKPTATTEQKKGSETKKSDLSTKKQKEIKKVLTKPKTQAISKPKTLSERHKLDRKKTYAKQILEKKSAEKKALEKKLAEKLVAEQKKKQAEEAKKQKKGQKTQQKTAAKSGDKQATAKTDASKKATTAKTTTPTAKSGDKKATPKTDGSKKPATTTTAKPKTTEKSTTQAKATTSKKQDTKKTTKKNQ